MHGATIKERIKGEIEKLRKKEDLQFVLLVKSLERKQSKWEI